MESTSNRKKSQSKKTAKKSASRKKATGRKGSSTKKKSRYNWGKYLAWLLLIVFFALVLSLFVGGKGHFGIDVSHHQGKINWEQVVKDGGVEFAYIKATEGVNYTDKRYKTNKTEARKQGIPVGPYHFFRADKSGSAQFAHFKEVIGRDFDLIPVLDLEELGGKISDKAAYQKEVETFIELFRLNYGYRPIVYGSHSFMKNFVHPAAKGCDYWLAWYTPLAKAVRDKRRFLNSVRPFLHARMWQYSDSGKIPGITENVDLDVCWEIFDLKVK